MKSLLVILSLIFSTQVLASAHVGEYSSYNVLDPSGQPIGQLHSVYASFDASSRLYTSETTTTIGGNRNVERETIKEDEVWSHEAAQLILANCIPFGGQPETLSVLGANYPTCKLPTNTDIILPHLASLLGEDAEVTNGFVWIGDFATTGIAKLESPQVLLTLTATHWNN